MRIDFSRPPNADERRSLERRQARLEGMAGGAVRTATDNLRSVATRQTDGMRLRLRIGYAFIKDPAPQAASDRSLPRPEDRPPATSLMSPRGAALRFHLLALAEAQLRTRAGQTPRNDRRIRAYSGEGLAWTDLIASDATDQDAGRTAMNIREKKVRLIQSSLDRLDRRRLVRLPNRHRGAGKYEGFELLEEIGVRPRSQDPVPYSIPRRIEPTFDLPMTFVLNGWIYVLEDTEIALLLMVACGRGSIDDATVAIPAGVRLRQYGLGRDAFDAHKRLANMDLLDVESVNRHVDGRAEDFENEAAMLHRLSLLEDGFEAQALPRVLEEVSYQLGR